MHVLLLSSFQFIMVLLYTMYIFFTLYVFDKIGPVVIFVLVVLSALLPFNMVHINDNFYLSEFMMSTVLFTFGQP